MSVEDIEKAVPPATEDVTESTSLKKSQSNIAVDQPVAEAQTPPETETAAASPTPVTSKKGVLRSQLQAKVQFVRDAWTQHQVKVTKDNCQLFAIILLTIVGLACNVAAIASNRWTCDLQLNFGLWDTCYQPITDGPIWEDKEELSRNSTAETDVVVEEGIPSQPIKCAKQGVRWVEIELAQQGRIDRVYAAQAMIVIGCILYAFSLFTICIAYRFVRSSGLRSLKNALIVSVAAQFFAFFFMLVGVYLFIFTEQFSISVGLLFVYFGLAMFASNTVNFFTVEYRSYKKNKNGCASTCS